MNLSTIVLSLLYGAAILFILFYIYRSQQPSVVVYPVATEVVYPNVVYSDSSWWPWSISSYNVWPYWTGWWSGGGNGGYRYWRGGRHRGHRGDIRPIGSRPGAPRVSAPSGGAPRGGAPRGGAGGSRGGAGGSREGRR